MRIQAANIGFGAKLRNNTAQNEPNIFGNTTLGVMGGVALGQLARTCAPISDEFFFEVSKENSDKKQEITKFVDTFIKEQASFDIDEARLFKTAAMEAELDKKSSAIAKLVNEPLIAKIDDNDSPELKNSLKIFKENMSKDLSHGDEKERLSFLEYLSSRASESLKKAKQGMIVKQKLEFYSQNIKGIGENGSDSIKTVRNQIKADDSIGSSKKEVLKSFNTLVQSAKISQRPAELWVGIPTVLAGICAFAISVNKKLQMATKKDS